MRLFWSALSMFLQFAQLGAVIALVAEHKLASAVISWLLFSAGVDGMPKPDAGSGKFYRWAHASLNLLAGNIFRVFCALSPRFGALLGTNRETPGNDP